MTKKIYWGLFIVFVLIQFVRIDKTNPEVDPEKDFLSSYKVPPDIASRLNASCMDCHSHTTKYPWYTNVAPISWWLKGHINGGRQAVNFSVWNTYDKKKKEHKIQDIVEVIEKKWMPLTSYTWMHPDGKLNPEERTKLASWFNQLIPE